MGVSVYKHKVIAFVRQRRLCRARRRPVRLFRAIYRAEQFQLRTVGAVPARRDDGRAQVAARPDPRRGDHRLPAEPARRHHLFRIIAGGHRRRSRWSPAVARILRKPRTAGAASRSRSRSASRFFVVLAVPAEDHRLQADHLRRDDPVRRLLSAGRHRRVSQQARRAAGPAARRSRRSRATPADEAQAITAAARDASAAGARFSTSASVVMQFGGLKALDDVDARRSGPAPSTG